MDPITLTLISQVVSLLMSAAASLPAVVQAGKTAVHLLESNTDPTPEQEAAIRTALDEADAALQAG